MPHLQFETSVSVPDEEVRAFTAWVTDQYAEVMDTGTGHVAVTIRDGTVVTLGRADPEAPVAVLNADVRAGRSFDQRETFATRVMDALATRWAVPREHMYVIYTEHPGEDFILQEGALASWAAGEAEPSESA